MEYNEYGDYYLDSKGKYKRYKASKSRDLNEYANELKYEAPVDPIIDFAEKNDLSTDISRDTLLVAKQFMVFAHIRCPKPPIRYARGLLQSTIRPENTSYLGMDSVNVYCGNEEAFYMPFTNEEWHSAKAYPVKNSKKIIADFEIGIKASYETSKRYGDTRTYEQYKKDALKYYEETMGTKNVGVRINPNEHWWDKAIEDVVNLCQERGVMMNG